MPPKNRPCVIVDGYSSGNLLAPEFNKRGYHSVHVQSTPRMLKVFEKSFHPEHFKNNLINSGNIEALLVELAKFKPHCIVAGAESGVELADLLSQRLGLLSNGTELSQARRDKFEMARALEQNGLRAIKSYKTDKLQQAIDWIERQTGYPVILKPLKSAGTDDVFYCADQLSAEQAFQTILGKKEYFWDSQSPGFNPGLFAGAGIYSRYGQL